MLVLVLITWWIEDRLDECRIEECIDALLMSEALVDQVYQQGELENALWIREY